MTTAPAAAETTIDLLFAGTVFCDLVFAGVTLPEPGAEVYATDFTMSPGGVATRAVAGARLGSRTALLSQLGDDFIGQYLFGALAVEPNLDVARIRRQAGFKSPVTVALTGQHERQFITYQEPAHPLEWAPERPPVAAIHVSIEHELPDWVDRLRGCGTTVYGGVGWDPSGLWSRTTLDRLAQVDVFVPNEAEARRYTGTADVCAAARTLGREVGLAVVTRGGRGVVAYDAATDSLIEEPAVRVPALDPTGAGDIFVASLMSTEQLGWPLDERLRLASLCGAMSVRTLGGATSAPRPADILEFLDQTDPPGDWATIRSWVATTTNRCS